LFAEFQKNYSTTIFTKVGGKMAHGPRNKPSDFGANPYYVMFGFR